MKNSAPLIAFALLFLACCSAQTYTALTPAQIASNAQVQALIKTGLARVISLGQQKNQFNSTDFSVSKINNVSRATVTNGSSYKIDVIYINKKNETVHAKFTGLYNTKTNKTSISTISYTVQYPRTSSSTNPTNSTSTPVDVGQLQTNATLKGLFNYGFNLTIQNAIKSGKIPSATYAVTKVNSISQQNSTSGPIYTFNAVATNAAKTPTVTLNFTVASQKKLTAYSFSVKK